MIQIPKVVPSTKPNFKCLMGLILEFSEPYHVVCLMAADSLVEAKHRMRTVIRPEAVFCPSVQPESQAPYDAFVFPSKAYL